MRGLGYSTTLNNVLNFFRFKWNVTGPCKYFDLTFCFFLIKIPLLIGNKDVEPSNRRIILWVRIKTARHIFPFLLNLNLKPLYSSRGGSMIRADPLTKSPTVVVRLWKPLYKWKIRSQRTLVLSAAWIQLCLLIIMF